MTTLLQAIDQLKMFCGEMDQVCRLRIMSEKDDICKVLAYSSKDAFINRVMADGRLCKTVGRKETCI